VRADGTPNAAAPSIASWDKALDGGDPKRAIRESTVVATTIY
jgi:hypothetical protein